MTIHHRRDKEKNEKKPCTMRKRTKNVSLHVTSRRVLATMDIESRFIQYFGKISLLPHNASYISHNKGTLKPLPEKLLFSSKKKKFILHRANMTSRTMGHTNFQFFFLPLGNNFFHSVSRLLLPKILIFSDIILRY